MLELSLATARKYLKYYHTSGRLVWKISNSNSVKAGQEAGCLPPTGYRQIKIEGKLYKAHRVCWLLYHGRMPSGQIDHINGDPSDNRIKNLRVVSNAENGKNQKRHCKNTSGCTGVYWYKASSKWQAEIMVDGRHIHLGYFTDFEDAVSARKRAERKYGFHLNHGRKP